MAVIKGELGEYNVFWRRYGESGAEVVVFRGPVYRKFFFGLLSAKNKPVWQTYATIGGNCEFYHRVQKYTPEQMLQWFQFAVDEYEKHIKAWNGDYFSWPISDRVSFP